MTALWLVVAAFLEVGGDASMRIGLRGQKQGFKSTGHHHYLDTKRDRV